MNVTELEALQILADKIGYQLNNKPKQNKSNRINEVTAKYYQQVFWKNSEKPSFSKYICNRLSVTPIMRFSNVSGV